MQETLNFIDSEKVICDLCSKSCNIVKYSDCKVRNLIDGKLEFFVNSKFVSLAIDPIEKKPLYHFYPTKPILSVGFVGCNLHCQFCQNYSISQCLIDESFLFDLKIEEVIKKMKEEKIDLLAFTYNEPTIYYEYLMKVLPILKEEGIKVVLVTNAAIKPKYFENLLNYVDAVNIDLKGDKQFYIKYTLNDCFDNVIENIRLATKKVHTEVTTLVIPGLNEEFVENYYEKLVDKEIPVHLSAYRPMYKMNIRATKFEELLVLYNKLKEQSYKWVYLGNVLDEKYNSTYCPQCGSLLIRRVGYMTEILGIDKNKKCKSCGSDLGSFTL